MCCCCPFFLYICSVLRDCCRFPSLRYFPIRIETLQPFYFDGVFLCNEF